MNSGVKHTKISLTGTREMIFPGAFLNKMSKAH